MNLRDLKYLVAVAEHQHFGKAASACFVSQPALSMQLQKLEETLGVQLFERSNKRVKITSVSQEIITRARRLLLLADEIQEVAKSYHDPFAGEFRLGAFPTLAPYYLPGIVPKIHKALPKLTLLLVEEKTARLLEMLDSGELDAALIALPVNGDQRECQKLLEDPFLLAVPENHPLSGRKSITLEDIKDERLLLLEEGHCLRSQALEVCDLVDIKEHKEFRATSLETLRQMVIAGVGITLIPKMAAKKDKHICYLPFERNAPSRSIGLVWRKHAARELCIRQVSEVIQ